MSLRASVCASAFGMLFAAGVCAQDVPAPSTMNFGYVDGSDTVQISVSGGDVVARLNGGPMPEERLQEEGQEVRCLDANGRLVAVLRCDGSSGTLRTVPRFKPRLRLGVTVAPPDEALAEHLGLEAAKCLHVTAVAEDGAGDKAGLLTHDIIVSLDGSESATRQDLRALLAAKEDGDRVVIDLVRRGVRTALEVELEAGEFGAQVGDLWANQLAESFDLSKGIYLDAQDTSQTLQVFPPILDRLLVPQQSGVQADYMKFVSPSWGYPVNTVIGEEPTVEGQADESLGAQLDRLEQRLEKLEALLAGLNKKLK